MTVTFSEDDFERVRSHIARAEKGSSVEIVPYVVWRSDNYEVVGWRGAAVASTFFLVAALLIYLFYQGWGLGWLYTGPGAAIGFAVSGVAGAWIVRSSAPLFRLVAGSRLLARRARDRAERAFIEERIFRTNAATGILIFISLWEHRIEVIADTAVSSVVPSGAWEQVVEAARAELRRGEVVAALVAAVDACGEIVKASGLAAELGDSNELDDALRVGGD